MNRSIASIDSIVRIGDVFEPLSDTWPYYEVVVDKVTRPDYCWTFPHHGIGQWRWENTEHPIVITESIRRDGPDSRGRLIMPGVFIKSANSLLREYRLIGRDFHSGLNPTAERIVERHAPTGG